MARQAMSRLFSVCFVSLVLAGCTSYGVIENDAATDVDPMQTYSIRALTGRGHSQDMSLILAFSGGGTRAAALAYGVLQELRDTPLGSGENQRRLLDEIDVITSVSGGSFASAYYGLHGDRIFDDFEDVFLRQDFQGHLIRSLFNPAFWLSSTGRTEMAVKFYEKQVFHDATFADMRKAGGPLVVINASDLGYGVRFSFVQEWFNLLCSDISSFPVARAVTASSAVPVLFNPVVVRNYMDCKQELPGWLTAAAERTAGDVQMTAVVEGLKTYFLNEDRDYAHLVDGGITDNLGLRAVYEVIEGSGGAQAFVKKRGGLPPRQVVIIAVNASTDPEPFMDKSNRQPSAAETISAMSDVQLHRYNIDTIELLKARMQDWARELSTPERPVNAHLVHLTFKDLKAPEDRQFINGVPTSFDLSDEQVDRVIAAGRELLRTHPEFRRFLAEYTGDPATN